MRQETFTDMEYSCRKKKTKREEFLEIIHGSFPYSQSAGDWAGQLELAVKDGQISECRMIGSIPTVCANGVKKIPANKKENIDPAPVLLAATGPKDRHFYCEQGGAAWTIFKENI